MTAVQTSTRVNRRTTGRGRFYVDARGERYWSVTTLLKGVPKDALMYWTAKEAAICAVDNLDRVKAIVGDDGDGRDAAIDWIKGACWRSSGKKMELGSLIHEIIESMVLDRPMPPIPDEAQPYVDQFLDFQDKWAPQWEASELTVYSRSQKHAGTLDLIGIVPGHGRLLIDTKTGSGVYPETALQISAYRHSEFVELPDGTEQPVPEVDGGAVLHLRPDGYELIPVDCDRWVYDVFLWAREIYRWMNETSKSVVGDPLIRETVKS